MKPIDPQIARAIGIHGARWRTVHDGYFVNSVVALPLIGAIRNAMAISSPAVVADLGGGTGFVLQELLKQGDYPGVRFINVDLSDSQLDEENDPRILPLQASVRELTRDLLEPGDGPVLFVMRSLLHYFGSAGVRPILRHLRSQMEVGEFLVHQTACFEDASDAQCLNLLYLRMRTDKWYPTINELGTCLREEGWAVQAIQSAPKIPLPSCDLVERYHLSEEDVRCICDEMTRLHGEAPEVFLVTPDGFEAYLHYQIFTCVAV